MTFLDWADITLMAAGTLVVAVLLVRWGLAGGPDFLNHCPIRVNRISPMMLWFCLVAYLLGGAVGYLLGTQVVPAALPESVRDAWVGVAASAVMQILTAGACLVVARLAFKRPRSVISR